MTCDEIETLLHPYVDGELEGSELVAFEAHLGGCQPCQAAVAEQRALKVRMRQAGSEPGTLNSPAPESLRLNIVAAIEKQSRRRMLMRPAIAIGSLAAAAAALVAWIQIGAERETSRYAEQAVAHHRRQLPLEVRDPQLAQIRSWFINKVDFSPSRIPDLHRVNPVGARLSNLGSRQAAYVAYGTPDEHRISLFVFDAPDLDLPSSHRRVDDREVFLANQNGYNVALWKDHEIAYSLVSDLDEQDILELVAASRR